MEPTLAPHLALAYLRELSTDVRAGVILDRGGKRLAGGPEIEAGARALLRAGEGTGWLQVRTSAGWVFAASRAQGALVLITGPHALPGLARHDLEAVTEMLFPDHRGAGSGEAPGTAVVDGREDAAPVAPGEALEPLAEAIHAALAQYARRPDADR